MQQQLQRIDYEDQAAAPAGRQVKVRHGRYQELYWHLPSPALIFDVGSFELRGLNRAAAQLFGCEVNQAVGQNIQPWLPAGLAARIRDGLWDAGLADTPLSGRGVHLGLPAGARAVNITAFNLPPERDGACRQWVLLCEDLTAQDALRELDRAELARNLHDQLGQDITVLRLALGRVQREFAAPGGENDWQARMDDLTRQTDILMQSVRQIACNLRPDTLDTLGLAGAASRLVRDLRRQLGVRGGLEVSLDWIDPDPALSLQMYRCLQELLNNMAKHSKASRFFVRMLHREGVYWLEVIDNGIGLAASKTSDGRARLGLAGLRERAALYGGELAVQSRPQVDGCAMRLSFRERRGAGGRPA